MKEKDSVKPMKEDSALVSTVVLSATVTVAAISLYLGFRKVIDPLYLLSFELAVMMVSVICMLTLLLRDVNALIGSKVATPRGMKREEKTEPPTTHSLSEEQEEIERLELPVQSEEKNGSEENSQPKIEAEAITEEVEEEKGRHDLPLFLKKEVKEIEEIRESTERKTGEQIPPLKIEAEEKSTIDTSEEDLEEDGPTATSEDDVLTIMAELKSELKKFSEIFKKAKDNV